VGDDATAGGGSVGHVTARGDNASNAEGSRGSRNRAVLGRVLALCEFKSGCFEIAAALRQHEPNLALAQAGGNSAPLLRAGADPRAPLLAIPTGVLAQS
jgi:hypothetical protein